MISLTIETRITNIKGVASVGAPLVMDIEFIICMNVIIRKYTFASFLNYSKMFLGKKVNTVYFAVLIRLFGNIFCLCLTGGSSPRS